MNKILFFLNVVIIVAIATIIAVNAWNPPNNNPPYSTNQAMYINPSGNVGIGTTNPAARLDVKGIDRSQTTFGYNDGTRDYGIYQWDNGGGSGNAPYNYLQNNVGIGTTAPGAKLEVAGQIKITGGGPGAGRVLVSDSSGLASWQGFRGTLVYNNTNQSIPTNTSTYLSFNSEIYDTSSIHDTVTNNSRLTVPAGVTKVKLSAKAYWEAPGLTNFLVSVYIRKNGNNYPGMAAVAGPASGAISTVTIQQAFSSVVNVNPGDYFEVLVVHGYGSNINVSNYDGSSTWFAMEIIE